MALNRIPYVTLIFMALNVMFYFVGKSAEAPYRAAVQARERDLVGYFTQHPDLELPSETLAHISPGGQMSIGMVRSQKLKIGETLTAVDEKLTLMEHFLESDDPSEPKEPEDPQTMQAVLEAERKRRQAELDGFIHAFEASLEKSFYQDFGFVPAQGNLKTMFTSLFLHDRFFRLSVNLALLLGLGYAIEGAWHSLVFPVFYLCGGLFAALTYKLSAPASTLPLLGMAGALAALAGAFAVRSYDSAEVAGSLGKGLGVLIVTGGILFGMRAVSGHSAIGDLIGGVVFGAAVAGVFRLTHFERNVLLPEEDRQAALANQSLTRGMALLGKGQVDEALEELKQASEADPANHVIARELCKAYARKGAQNPAVRKFKQVMAYHLKHEALADAVDDYVELSDLLPDVVLDTAQHLQLAAALEERAAHVQRERLHPDKQAEAERRFFTKAADAYRNFIAHQQQTAKTLDLPETVTALTHYADICAAHLNLASEAQQAYQTLLGLSQVSPEQKQAIQAAMRRLAPIATSTAPRTAPPPIAPNRADTVTSSETPRPNVPLQQRLKLVQERNGAAKYPLRSVAPINAKQVTAMPDGLNLGRDTDSSILFQRIYAIFIAQFPDEQDEVKARQHGAQAVTQILAADIFIGGQQRPYRVPSSRIAYPQFLPKPHQNSVKNFHQFLLYLIQQVEAVYIDQGTFEFLKTGKIPQYSGQDAVEKHARNLWQQLVGLVRVQCAQCWEVYWVDRGRIPEKGATTPCAKCGYALSVKR